MAVSTFSLSRRLHIVLWFILLNLTGAHAAKFSKVVIDAGHGGHDNGAKIGNVYEKHLALDVARRLERYLNNQKIKTVMTRSTDTFVTLEDRAKIANGTRDSVFVSIHFNMVSYSGPTGVETWYHSKASHTLAYYTQHYIASGLSTVNRGVKSAKFKVLRLCTRPAVLVEGGFISTKKDLKRILDPRYRQKLAESIGQSLLQYRKTK